MEGSWEAIVGCVVHVDVHVVHVDVHGVYVVGGSTVVAIEHGKYSLSCMQKL